MISALPELTGTLGKNTYAHTEHMLTYKERDRMKTRQNKRQESRLKAKKTV